MALKIRIIISALPIYSQKEIRIEVRIDIYYNYIVLTSLVLRHISTKVKIYKSQRIQSLTAWA